jgi:hypothetical protein
MDFIHVASLVAAELVEAALSATDTEFVLRWKPRVDGFSSGATRGHRESGATESAHDKVSGLDLVAANSRTWGTYPTLSGNTIGPSSAPRIVFEPIRCQRS